MHLIDPDPINLVYERNGPGKFEVGKDLIIHPFDGDGMLTAITISNSTATFRNRFVATKVCIELYSTNAFHLKNNFVFKGIFAGEKVQKSKLSRSLCHQNNWRAISEYFFHQPEKCSKYQCYILGRKTSCLVGRRIAI